MRILKHSCRFVLSLFLLCALIGCEDRAPVVYVDPGKTEPVGHTPPEARAEEAIHLGIGSIITPKEGYTYYRHLVDYLEQKLQRPVNVIDRGTYQEFNDLLAEGELDVAFVCGGPYVEGRETFDLELLVVPETPGGETVYYSDLIVPSDSNAESLEDLRGKRFAFTDPHSNSGRLVPTYLLAQMGEKPEQFFSELIYTYAHDKSIHAVMEKTVDGASVDSLIYDYMVEKDPEVLEKTKVIAKSDPYGIPPVVVRPDIPDDLRLQLRTALLQMNKDPRGRTILEGMKIQRFVESSDASYDTIRQIREFTRQQAGRANDK